jgi:periplasmic divalent cation tolerance protein
MLNPLPKRTRAKVMIEEDKILIALTTCPIGEIAEHIANVLVTERLAACVNRVPGIISTYIWNDRLRIDAEVLLIIKTTESRFDILKTRLIALHTDELPELIAIPVCAGAENYLSWVRDTVKSSP